MDPWSLWRERLRDCNSRLLASKHLWLQGIRPVGLTTVDISCIPVLSGHIWMEPSKHRGPFSVLGLVTPLLGTARCQRSPHRAAVARRAVGHHGSWSPCPPTQGHRLGSEATEEPGLLHVHITNTCSGEVGALPQAWGGDPTLGASAGVGAQARQLGAARGLLSGTLLSHSTSLLRPCTQNRAHDTEGTYRYQLLGQRACRSPQTPGRERRVRAPGTCPRARSLQLPFDP